MAPRRYESMMPVSQTTTRTSREIFAMKLSELLMELDTIAEYDDH